MRMCDQALELARDLGLYGKNVFFNDWVSYEERKNYLLESDIGISLHFDCLETRLSFRTRILDYIWAGLPVVTTRGDTMSQLIKRHGLGKVVDYEDAEEVAAALLELLSIHDLRETYRARFEKVAGQRTWDRVACPLMRFCAHPWSAADRDLTRGVHAATHFTPWWLLPAQAWRTLQRGGLTALHRAMSYHLRQRLGRFLPPDRSGSGV
jgi:glycosyltransferase involved in cell wall biosynthesis